MTLRQSIVTARGILHDTDADSYRYSDDDLLRYANDALDQIVMLVPSYFYERGNVQCVAGEAAQTVGFTDARALVSVDRIRNGRALTRVEKGALDAFNPGWPTMPPAPAVHWMNHADSPVRFYVYPPSPAGQVLEVTYVRTPLEYSADDDTGLPATLADAVADYIVYRAESRDDEHINSNRASQFLASFVQKVKGV